MVSRIDQIYRSILLTKFFVRGWGKPENLRRLFAFRKILSNRETCQQLVDKNHPITITKEVDNGDHIVLEAEFISPFVAHLPGLLPKESEKATFQLVFPKVWRTHLKPTCLHLAGTGDHGFWRRKMLMGKPLLDESGIASAILENPFYGCRKPKDQIRSSLHNVSDLFVMGGCLVLESLAIFNWCERLGFGPLGITGISMGGHMASLAATSWPKPLPLIPCLSWSTASGVFTQGVLSGAINWEMLKNQYFSNEVFREELFDMIQSPEGHFPVYHEVGQKFARDFPGSLSHVEQLMQDQGQNLRQHKHKLDDSHSDNKNEIRNSEFKSDDIRSAQNTRKSSQVEGSGSESQYYTGTVHNVAAGRGGGPLGISLSLPRFNILQSFGLSKSKVSKGQPAQANKDAATSSNHILVGYRKSKSNISKPVHEFTPVGIRPKSSANTKTVKFDPYMEVKDTLTWEAVQFMRGVMDECTHLGNFSVPVDPSLVIIVAAENDGYMPRDGIIPLNEIWPGSQVRTIRTGHVTAYLFNHQVFRQAIKDSFDQVIAKYYS
ncbi:protein ABHD18-like isoform X2 [Homarus americanus]|uniref:protein ABHD18-like isoform X2 n=1 Tax=Homarus americanus TaxID=6706 RepID=UPI001C4447F0|nr:protein ABHD18-like isoform X2 [Homarus americanus]